MDLSGNELRQLAQTMELSEARAYESMVNAPDAQERAALGMGSARIGSAVAVMTRAITSSLNLNRVIGLGLNEPITEAVLDQVTSLYLPGGAPYALELCPFVLSPELKLRLRARQLRGIGTKTAMFIHHMKRFPCVECDLRIERVDGRHADQLADIACEMFGMPAQTGRMLSQVHRQPGWQQWMGFAGDQPAGVALSFMADSVAWSGWAATLPAFRGRRFHAAYLAKAVRHAAQSGCRYFTAETATGTPQQRDPAYRNLVKLGFEAVYERDTYMGQAQQPLPTTAARPQTDGSLVSSR